VYSGNTSKVAKVERRPSLRGGTTIVSSKQVIFLCGGGKQLMNHTDTIISAQRTPTAFSFGLLRPKVACCIKLSEADC